MLLIVNETKNKFKSFLKQQKKEHVKTYFPIYVTVNDAL